MIDQSRKSLGGISALDDLEKLNPDIRSHLVVLVRCKLSDDLIEIVPLGNQQALIDGFAVPPVFQGFCFAEENLDLFLCGWKFGCPLVCDLDKQTIKSFCTLIGQGFPQNKNTGKDNRDNEDGCDSDFGCIAASATARGLGASGNECRGRICGGCGGRNLAGICGYGASRCAGGRDLGRCAA